MADPEQAQHFAEREAYLPGRRGRSSLRETVGKVGMAHLHRGLVLFVVIAVTVGVTRLPLFASLMVRLDLVG